MHRPEYRQFDFWILAGTTPRATPYGNVLDRITWTPRPTVV